MNLNIADLCPDGFEDWNIDGNFCYRILNSGKVNWKDARTRCQKIGGSLIRITSESERKMFMNKLGINKRVWTDLTKETGLNIVLVFENKFALKPTF